MTDINQFLFGNSISAYLSYIQRQERIASSISPLASLSEIIVKQIQNNEKFSLNSSLALTSPLLHLIKNVNPIEEKFGKTIALSNQISALFSSVNAHQSLFDKFYKQSDSIAKMINPSVSDLLNHHVKSHYDNLDSLTSLEAIYLQTFESVKDNYSEAVQVEIDEVTKELESNPSFLKEIQSLFWGIVNDVIPQNTFDALKGILSKRFKIENEQTIMNILVVIFFTSTFLVSDENQISTKKIKQPKELTHVKKSSLKKQISKPVELSAKELDDCKEQFFNQMNGFVSAFEKELLTKYKPQTVRKYTHIASVFVHYLHDHTNHIKFEDIKQSDTNSRFISASKWEGLEDIDTSEVKSKMKVFLEFLKEQGLVNKKIFKD